MLLSSLADSRPGTNPAPPAPIPCKMNNGQPRPFPCEFQIQTVYFLGANNEVAGKITPTNTTVKLPKSKAVKIVHSTSSDSYMYNVSLDFKRINTPSFSPRPTPVPGPVPATGFYEVGMSTIDSPISPGEVIIVKKVNVSPDLPPPGVRPVRVTFILQLNYSTGSNATIVAPVQYVQIKNPITFTKLPASANLYRDRSEAWIAFKVGVDMAN